MMLRCLRDNYPCVPAGVVDFVVRRAAVLVAASVLLALGLAIYTALNFKIDTDFSGMVSDEVPFRQELLKFRKAFPQLKNSLVLVIDAPLAERAAKARELLLEDLGRNPGEFRSIYSAQGDKFFKRNGLLYLDEPKLLELSDQVAQVQPFLGLLSDELSLKRLFNVLGELFKSEEALLNPERIKLLLEQVNRVISQTGGPSPEWISWQALMRGSQEKGLEREFILILPHLDFGALNPAKPALSRIKQARTALKEKGFGDVTVRITGSLALNVENLSSVRQGIGLAALISLLLVVAVLIWGLRSTRLLFYSLITLLVGLLWTLGFAMLFVGRLNIISVTFVVLFIGLGIDYSIQYCLRYKELILGGHKHVRALWGASQETGNALLLCTLTTAIGFYAFAPTDYSGASELGVIAGTGMFLNLLANLTLLPALIHLRPPRLAAASIPEQSFKSALFKLPYRYSKSILVLSAVVFLLGCFLLPKVYFDYNPLNLNNQQAEPVQTAQELLAEADNSIWTISVLLGSPEQTGELAKKLEALPLVKKTISLASLVPPDQDAKLEVIGEMSLFLPEFDPDLEIIRQPKQDTLAAMESFSQTLDGYLKQAGPDMVIARTLKNSIDSLLERLRQPGAKDEVLAGLETAMLEPLKMLLTQLGQLTQAEPFSAAQLPAQLREQYLAGGLYRLQVFPQKDLNDLDNLAAFVSQVSQAAPGATGTPVGILGAGRTISRSFFEAFIIAVAAITLLLFLITRKLREVLLTLLPLLVSLALTAGATVIFKIPFNFANIIVVPLLLGIGLDYAIHLVHRHRVSPELRENILSSSTARGVLVSALTTIVSFSSLSFSLHQGTASIGIMLTICVSVMIACTLVMLPALLHRFMPQEPEEGEEQ
jgi:hopanoid biosynthesis associated RND transporter like protein HpnN